MSDLCDYYSDGEHDEFCPHAVFTETITKGDFVEVAEVVATAVVDSYQFGLDEGWEPEMAKSVAVSENAESAACYVGMGSCGRGGCKHS